MAPVYSLRDLSIFSLLTYQSAQCGRVSSEAVVGKATWGMLPGPLSCCLEESRSGKPKWPVASREEETSVGQATEIPEQLIISSSWLE